MRPDIFLATIGRGSNGSNALEVTEDRAGLASVNQDCLINSVNNVSQYGPSWHYYPSSIREDIAYTPVPTSGLGDLTFTRASDATYTDSTGVVRRSPYNLLLQSNTFSNASWLTSNVSVTSGQSGYDGTLNAWLLTSTLSNGFVYQNNTIDGINTFSIYGKAGTNTQIILYSQHATQGKYFDLSSGTVGANFVAAPISASIENVGGGWYRCSIVITASANAGWRIYNVAVGTTFIQNAQAVQGTSALDYFPTTNRQDVPRIDFRNADGTLSSCGRLLLEPQRTNSIRNSSMVGAVAGSPGTLPTNWTTSNAGLTRTIVGTGTENGLPYVDVRFNGTANSLVGTIQFEAINTITASVGQAWSNNLYVKNIDTTAQANQVLLTTYEFNSVGTYLVEGSASIRSQLTTSLKRFDFVRTLTSATVARVQPLIQFIFTNGATYDFTIRIAAPQMELGAYATTWVPTTTAAVTRIADAASKTGVSSLIGQTEGTLFFDFESGANDSVDNIFGISNGFTNNRIIIYRQNTNTINVQVRVAAGQQAFFQTSVINANSRYKCALAYKTNDVVFYVNGVEIGNDTSAIIPACSVIATNDGGGSSPFNRPINQAALFPTRLTNAQLAQLTTL